jgi:hypothetical protein
MMARKRMRLVLIKPSHYDDDGYVISWWRSIVPANSLACVHGLVREAIAKQVLGPDWDFDIVALDETNTTIRPEKLARDCLTADASMVMLVGVQSNQFMRALHIASGFRKHGITVGIGGFHVSGTLAMLPTIEPNVQKALDMGCFLFAGEAEEGRLGGVLRDAVNGELKPIYNYMNDLPSLEGMPTPYLTADVIGRTFNSVTSLDAGRGCPYQCSFCTIINVQGRKSRRRSIEDIEKIVRENVAQGVEKFFITDDNFARNKDWEAVFDKLAELRAEGIKCKFTIQVDVQCNKLPNFIKKARKAGVRWCFIGLENISPDNLLAAKKRQNKITEYRKMLLAWKKERIVTYCGYITGFPADTPERLRRDVATAQRELPLDILEFFYLTPLPGSEDHQKAFKAGVPMDPDLNKYDLNHVVVDHPHMSKAEWEKLYMDCWKDYYSKEHMDRVMRRNAALGVATNNVQFLLSWFSGALFIEKVHPLECGLVRRKARLNRRPELPREPIWSFYPKFWAETAIKNLQWVKLMGWCWLRSRQIERDPKKLEYTDIAITPVDEHEEEREMFQTEEAHAFVVEQRRFDKIKHDAVERVAEEV